jgi:hypothetical protein
VAGLAGSASAQTVVSADITTNTTWTTTGSPYILARPIFVKNDATLTILPGVVVRGQPRTAVPLQGSTAGTPGALIVTQSGRLVASASASNPIIMTTAATDNGVGDGVADDVDGNGFADTWEPGDTFLDDAPTTAPLAPFAKNGTQANTNLWGGLVLLGEAPTNLRACNALNEYGKAVVEGLTVPGFPAADATYGGVLPHDNSGILRYVSVRHAGDEIGAGNELNGITLAGVGDGTVLEFLEVYTNFDDGIEWFGGTVNGKNLVVSHVGDDSLDVDQGYTGINQFAFVVMNQCDLNNGGVFGSFSGDKGGEFDGDDFAPDAPAEQRCVNIRMGLEDPIPANPAQDVAGDQEPDPLDTPWPLSYPQFFNVTLIGSEQDAGADFTCVDDTSTNRGIQFRNGFAGEVHNSIIVNTGGETGIEDGGGGTPGWTSTNNATNDLLNVFCTTMDDGLGRGAREQTIIDNGDQLIPSIGGTLPGAANSVNAVTGTVLVKEDTTFDPTGNAAGKLVAALKSSPINPRPRVAFPPLPIGGCPAPGGDFVDPGATYRGAFASGAATQLWTDGWSVLSQGGLLD